METNTFTFQSQIASDFDPEAEIVLYHGDVMDLLSTLPSKFARLVITSPPYNLGKAYETRIALKTYLDIQKEIIEELVRVLADDGSICWQVGNFVEKGEVYPLDIYYYDIISVGQKT